MPQELITVEDICSEIEEAMENGGVFSPNTPEFYQTVLLKELLGAIEPPEPIIPCWEQTASKANYVLPSGEIRCAVKWTLCNADGTTSIEWRDEITEAVVDPSLLQPCFDGDAYIDTYLCLP